VEMVQNKAPSLTFRVVQGLGINKVRGLNVDNVASFYANLENLYELHPTFGIVMN
jgi:hypothetical protein